MWAGANPPDGDSDIQRLWNMDGVGMVQSMPVLSANVNSVAKHTDHFRVWDVENYQDMYAALWM